MSTGAYAPRLFQQRMWMQSAASIYSLLGAALAVHWLAAGLESAWWLAASAAGYLAMLVGVSTGYHRLFTHGSFRTSRVWEVILAVLGTLSWSGSPAQWRALHTVHHRFADTERDPHVTTPDYFLWKRYKPVPLHKLAIRRLLRDPFHRALHFYYALVPLAIMLALLAADPRALVFGLLLPMTAFNVVGTLHQVISHKNGRPRDIAWLEFLLPFGGEWMHGRHHENAKARSLATKWWHVDIGAWVIRAIGSPA